MRKLGALVVLFAVSVATAAAESREEAIRRIDSSWGDAFQTCNVKRMGEILSDQLVFIVQNGIVHGKKEQMASVGRCDMKQMTVHPERVRVFGNTALVHGTLDYRLEGPRGNLGGTLAYSRVYVKEGSAWRMVQHQSTALAVPRQTASLFEQLTPIHIGIIVHDIDQTAKVYREVFGVDVPPARTVGPNSWPENPAGPATWTLKLTSFKLGTTTIELVQPLNGSGPHRGHLERFGPGIHHLAFTVPDRDAAFAFLRSRGGTQVSSTYVDFKDSLGMTVEIAPPSAPR